MTERLNKFIEILSNPLDILSYITTPSPSPDDDNLLPIDITKTIKPPQFIPTINEAIIHLKLLKAFQVMKNKVLINYELNDEYREKYWQSFITLAVRRFIVFISAIREKNYKNYINSEGRNINFRKTELQIFNDAIITTTITNDNQKWFINMMNDLMPPLDVIMVWHSFLLNPKTFYDTCLRNNVLNFANYPLPLYKINQFIDNYTFEFNVDYSINQKNYLNLIKSFTNDTTTTTTTNDDNDNERDINQYDIATNFSLNKQLVRFYCPGCKKILTDWIKINDKNQMGLADRNLSVRTLRSQSFIIEDDLSPLPPQPSKKCAYTCPCINISMITHESLRILHLIVDAKRRRNKNTNKNEIYPLLPGIYKYFSLVICNPKYSSKSPITLNKNICQAIEKSYLVEKNLITIINDILTKNNINININININEIKKIRIILRNYLQFNYISSTVKNGIEIGEDLVGCILRQEIFWEKINQIDWLHSPLIYESLKESLIRYKRFYLMLTTTTTTTTTNNNNKYSKEILLVPTLDIDLIWHTHQLSMYGYFHDCLTSSCHYVIDHNDKIDNNKLNDGFSFTSKKYKYLFKDNYSICYCQYCTNYRIKYTTNKKFLSLFQTKNQQLQIKQQQLQQQQQLLKNNPLFDGENQGSVTHISNHNSIQMPTKKAINRREKTPMPWDDNNNNKNNNANNNRRDGYYVVVPYAPIEIDHCQFYGTGLCNSVNAQCVSDSGKCCSFGGSACVTDNGLACGGDNGGCSSCGGGGGGCGGGGD